VLITRRRDVVGVIAFVVMLVLTWACLKADEGRYER